MNDSAHCWLALHTEMKTGSKTTGINYSNSATCTRREGEKKRNKTENTNPHMHLTLTLKMHHLPMAMSFSELNNQLACPKRGSRVDSIGKYNGSIFQRLQDA